MEERKGIIFSRPPRFLPDIPSGELEIPPPPQDQQKPEIQWLSILLPPIIMIIGSILMGMSMRGNSIFMYVTVATTVVTIFISLLNATHQIKKYKKYVTTRKKKYLQLISDLRTELSLAKEQQIAGMNEINPSPSVCIERLMNIDSRLWERIPAHRDFLSVRLGIGSIPASLKPKYQKPQLLIEPDPLQEEPAKLGREFELIPHLPVCLDLLQSEVSGIAGTKEEVNALLRIIVLQLITNHSYSDVKVVLLIKEDELAGWKWIKQLPHVWDDDYCIRFIMCGAAIAHSTLSVIYEQLKDREIKQTKSEQIHYHFSQYIFIVTDSSLLEEEPIGKYLYSGHRHLGVTTIFAADCKQFLPMNCKSVVSLQGKVGTYVNKDSTEQFKFNIDSMEMGELERAARKLAAVRLKKSATNFTLPKSITLLETLGVKRIEEVDLMNYWSRNRTYNGMSVPIGVRAGGEPFNLDIQAYETSHGPHGLVAGTTGSGKSELLQSIIISLAIHFHPHDVVFVLIDYKGGGMADVFKGLPHLVGTITNLGGNQTTRALLSIKSELKRRQGIFSLHEVNNIDKYQKLYHSGKAKEPLPHLVMIADEFAELKAEQPDFMKELVSTARVGRSLGVHLILATQKPAGVVDDQIWSNSRFKICLKVQDETDSKDVIKRPDAAMIKEPGRGYIQVGNDEIFEMFQSTYAGADYDTDGQRKKKNKVFKVGLDGRTIQIYPIEQEYVDKSEKDSQLKAMVGFIKKQAKVHNIEPLKGPWLPPLQDTLYLDQVAKEIKDESRAQKVVWAKQEEELIAAVGIYDDPRGQKQEPIRFNFASEGNLIIYGTSGVGKTTLLESIILSLAAKYSPEHVHIYMMDFGSGSLKKFERLPHCGGVMTIENEEKINQFILFVFRMIAERKEAFNTELVDNLQTYNKRVDRKFPYIVLVIDNYFALSETYEEIDEKVLNLSREGSKYGIYIIITATSSALVRYKLSINFKMSVALQLTDESEYANIVGRTEGLVPDKVLGRGLTKVDYPVEFQTALPAREGKTSLELINYFASLQDISRATPIPQMPERIDIFELNKGNAQDTLSIGLNQDNMLPITLDLTTNIGILICGDIQTGKSTALISWVKMIKQKIGQEKLELYLADSQNMGLFKLVKQEAHYNLLGEDIEEVVERIRRIIETRRRLLNEYRHNNEDIDALYNSWPQIVFVIDNIIEFIDNADFSMKEILESIIKKAYGLKMIILAAGSEVECGSSWEGMIKGLRDLQTGIVLGSIKDQSLFNVKVPYGYYEKELQIGDGYFIVKGRFTPIRLACKL